MASTEHLLAVQQRTRRTTDPIALNLFHQLRKMSTADRRLVLTALDGHLAGSSSERVLVVLW